MFGIGFVELCVIIVVALVFVGPKKLPDLMKQAGKFFVQVRRMTTDVKSTMDEVIHEAEREIRREEKEHLTKLINPSEQSKKDSSAHNPEGSVSAEPHGKYNNHHDDDHHHDHSHTHGANSPQSSASNDKPDSTQPASDHAKQEKQQG